jgi:hypothetical protein
MTILMLWEELPLKTDASAAASPGTMKSLIYAILVLSVAVAAHAQGVEKVQPAGAVRSAVVAVPRAIAREYKFSVTDFATFRDPHWSVLTLAQIGAASADAVTSVNNLNHCHCMETGPSRIFIGEHPDLHKYLIAGFIEVSAEAVLAHYVRNHEPSWNRKWYWRMLWTVPQSLSLFEHARASEHNAALHP